jgi:hypothetical protein
MIIEIVPSYPKEQDFTLSPILDCVITHCEKEANATGRSDNMLYFSMNGFDRRMSIWGDNAQNIVKALGSSTDKWKGATFQLEFSKQPNGKSFKVIHNVLPAKAP